MNVGYNKETRECAALICAIAASGGAYRDFSGRRTMVYSCIRDELGVSNSAMELAVLAWTEAEDAYGTWAREVDAEAEALIRSGWNP